MWRSSRNVRISYSELPPTAASSSSSPSLERNADCVEHVPISADGSDNLGLCERLAAAPRTIRGTNTAAHAGDASSWNWRGNGALFFVTSHWEILGWGERRLAPRESGGGGGDASELDVDARDADEHNVERWAVTWFQKTLFSDEGVDVYCDRVEGVSEETYALIRDALRGLQAKNVVELVENEIREVKIVI
jgi:hypothetical protein